MTLTGCFWGASLRNEESLAGDCTLRFLIVSRWEWGRRGQEAGGWFALCPLMTNGTLASQCYLPSPSENVVAVRKQLKSHYGGMHLPVQHLLQPPDAPWLMSQECRRYSPSHAGFPYCWYVPWPFSSPSWALIVLFYFFFNTWRIQLRKPNTTFL